MNNTKDASVLAINKTNALLAVFCPMLVLWFHITRIDVRLFILREMPDIVSMIHFSIKIFNGTVYFTVQSRNKQP